MLRGLQTSTYIILSTWCGATPTLFHITWECAEHGEEHGRNGIWDKWEPLLSSLALEDQQQLIRRDKRMAHASGALE